MGAVMRAIRKTTGIGKISYEKSRDLVASGDEASRRKLADREDAPPEVLYYLAKDPLASVRQRVAANDITPAQADLLLAEDDADEVRTALADKVCRLIATQDPRQRGERQAKAVETLEILARDQLIRVREIISETLKDVAHAPPEVIRQLAKDVEISVAGPVLQYSKVLTEADLLELIDHSQAKGAVSAIARREGLGERMSEAVHKSGDVGAIAALLDNSSAQIREEVLDAIVGGAEPVVAWHAPLVGRPKLPSGAVLRMAQFVAGELLQKLMKRKDLDKASAAEVRQIVEHRVAREASNETPADMARRMYAAGQLDEEAVRSALTAGDKDFVVAALAVRAGMNVAQAQRMLASQSGRAVTALAWKSGLDMRFAIQLQTRVARIAPGEVLQARGGTKFPLAPDDMEWQLEFFEG